MRDKQNQKKVQHRKLKIKDRIRARIRELQKQELSLPMLCLIAGVLLLASVISGKLHIIPEAKAEKSRGSNLLVMDFTGDIMIGGKISRLGDHSGYVQLFQGVKAYWDNADLIFANLDNAFPAENPSKYKKSGNLQRLSGSYKGLKALSDSGVNMFACANEHMYDDQEKAVEELIQYFKENNLDYAGIGTNLKEAAACRVTEVNGIRVGMISISDDYTAEMGAAADKTGIFTTEDEGYSELIREASKECDYLAVYVHFGEEDAAMANKRQKELAHRIADAGADLIIGTHPHVLQSMEVYEGVPIFYSLGNFISDETMSYNRDSAMMEVTVDRSGQVNMEIIPIRIHDGIPVEASDSIYCKRITRELMQDMNTDSYMIDNQRHIRIPCNSIDLDRLISVEEANEKAMNEAEDQAILETEISGQMESQAKARAMAEKAKAEEEARKKAEQQAQQEQAE